MASAAARQETRSPRLPETLEDRRKLIEVVADDIHRSCFALLSQMYRMAPFYREELDSTAFETRIDDFGMLFRRNLRLHRCVCETREYQIATEARLAEVHRVGAVAME